jgi:V8-like Glu-specific endopeptidase
VRALVGVTLALVVACLSTGSVTANEPVGVSFRGQGGMPRHAEAARVSDVREPAAVIGNDERTRVGDTTEYPYSAIALLSTFRGIDEFQCTGTFIGEDVLLTAAHCLWDPHDGWMEDILVKPGKDGFGSAAAGGVQVQAEPFGSEYAWDWVVPQEYITHNGTDSTWDFGLVVMTDADLGNTVGWLTVGNLQTTTLQRSDFVPGIVGYPSDLGDGEQQWQGTKTSFANVEDFLLYYNIDTGGGQSGSAIISLNTTEWFAYYVVGIHTTGTPDYNFGSRVDAELIETIAGMCEQEGCTIDHYTEPFVQGELWGDADCNGSLSARDNQAILRTVLGQAPLIQTEPCDDVGALVSVSGFGVLPWGDADCDGSLTARDNQALLRKVLLQPALSQTPPCPVIGALVTLGG